MKRNPPANSRGSRLRELERLVSAVRAGAVLGAVALGCAAESAPDGPATDGTLVDGWGTGGERGTDDLVGRGGEGGAAGAAATDEDAARGCDLKAEDDPDDRFEDSDCDGIDGSRADAVFIDPSGDDSGPGTLEAPLATVDAALALARAEDKDIYVCNGVYRQAVVIRSSDVRLFGGYDCAAGGLRVADRATFSPQTQTPLTIENADHVLVERIAFVAPDAGEREGSSLAAVVLGSAGVVLRRVELESGRGGPGSAGEPGLPLTGSARAGAAGTAACLELLCDDFGRGGFSTSVDACEGGSGPEVGGAGGDGGHPGVPAEAGLPSPSGVPGGRVSDRLLERDGASGGQGARGLVGTGPTQPIGELSGSSYRPSNAGNPGGYGSPGQAGGGGAGVGELWQRDLCCKPGHGGSQGGFGGCGGRPGQGGSGGGASIALVVVDSEVSLTWSRLVAGDGGQGGAGGKGGLPQGGGAAGDVYRFGDVRLSGVGGRGGDGGVGGPGGPGGGGPSLGLALRDARMPSMDSVQVLLGSPGFGGSAAPDAIGTVDGPDGLALAGYDFTHHQELIF